MGCLEKNTCSGASAFEKNLKAKVKTERFLSVASYMEDVNRHYYATRDPFGCKGDFTTAPEISQLFGEGVAFAFLNYLQRRKNQDPITVVELGPGRGTLMNDFLRVICGSEELKIHLKDIILIENSPVLRQKQQDLLAPCKFELPLHWFETLDPVLEAEGPFFIIANEFLDALPVHQLRWGSDQKWEERGVILAENGDFDWDWRCVSKEDRARLSRFLNPNGANQASNLVEVSPLRYKVFMDLLKCLQTKGGQAHFIDYGDDVLQGETLQALHKHRYVSVLDHPGEADITSHVDFGALQKGVASFPLLQVIYETQRHFLKRHYVDARLETLLRKATDFQKEELLSGAERLLDPEQMGTLFKVLSVSRE